jgi:hypothetical protein
METVHTVLSILFLTWAFWVAVPLLTLASYICVVNNIKDEDDSVPWIAFLFLSFAIWGLGYRFQNWVDVSNWRWWASMLGSYFGVGFGVSMYKWLSILRGFDRKAASVAIVLTRDKVKALYDDPRDQSWRIAGKRQDQYLQDELKQMADFKRCVVNVALNGATAVYPDWRKYPIATWWVYWPFFMFDVLLDPLHRLVKMALKFMRHFYDSIGKLFAAKV